MIKENYRDEHWQVLVLFLKEVAKTKGYTYDYLAKNCGVSKSTISRVFDLQFAPKIDLYMKIAQALDLNLFFETKDSTTSLNKEFEAAMEALGRRPGKLPKN